MTLFLSLIGAVGVLVGLVALLSPATLLIGKGVASGGAPSVWMRETGALILALSVIALLVRQAPASPTLRSVLWGNAIAHACLLPVEVLAWRAGVITRLGGVVPNTVLHIAAVAGFVFFALR